jgi:hypothetical protein
MARRDRNRSSNDGPSPKFCGLRVALGTGWRVKSAGVAKRPRERPPTRILLQRCTLRQVCRFLRDRAEFDVVHFHDYQGVGYYPLLAKQQGYPELQHVQVIVPHPSVRRGVRTKSMVKSPSCMGMGDPYSDGA